MKKIDTTKIRGKWQESKEETYNIVGSDIPHKQMSFSGGDDTIQSIEMVAEKVNEIIEWINSKKDQLL
jgi:hypothetical protein